MGKEDPKGSPASSIWTEYLITALFLACGSLVFTLTLERPVYQLVFERGDVRLSLSGTLLTCWLLWAKTMFCFLPLISLVGFLNKRGHDTISNVLLHATWIFLFYFFALDIVSMTSTGIHVTEYVPYVVDMLRSPELLYVWAPEAMALELGLVLSIVVFAGLIVLIVVRKAVLWAKSRSPFLASKGVVVYVSITIICATLGAFPVFILFGSANLVAAARQIIPFETGLLEEHAQDPKQDTSHSLALASGQSWNPPSEGKGLASSGRSVIEQRSIGEEEAIVNNRFLDECLNPKPADTEAFVVKSALPNIVLIIAESLRHSVLSAKLMPLVANWSQQGLRLDRHFSGGNCSETGIFSLVYGRVPVAYAKALERGIAPQLCESLRKSGYSTYFLCSAETRGWQQADKFINQENFDRVMFPSDFGAGLDVPSMDRRVISEIERLVTTAADRPVCVIAYLYATHHPYYYPEEMQLHEPVSKLFRFISEGPIGDMNRYKNSCAFTDEELHKLLGKLPIENNLVIITSDHGESFGEDGSNEHCLKPSDIQARVPCVIVGPGISPGQVSLPTSHADILPTLLHVVSGGTLVPKHSHGRDILSSKELQEGVAYMSRQGLVAVRGDSRMLFNYSDREPNSARFRFSSFLNLQGNRINAPLGSAR